MDKNEYISREHDEPEARWANQFKIGYRESAIELVFCQSYDGGKK
jgi:hypothetical protein